MISISSEQARRFLVNYHFQPTDLPGVFARLGTVQYDPLNPIGRNPDLVFQARVPNYQVDDWQTVAYTDRLVYDAWDKQACLVPVSDWPMRAMIRDLYRPYHDREVLQAGGSEVVESILAAIDHQGPLSSLEFEDKQQGPTAVQHSWYGTTQTKRILRAMWACGLLLTHHRRNGRHYYDRPERVIPTHHYHAPGSDEEGYYRWILARRYQATGLLRPTAEASIWTACGKSASRRQALAQLVEDHTLTPVQIHFEGKKQLYHMPTSTLSLLDKPIQDLRMLFLAPLDSFLWDRKAIQQLFHFDYTWEVYKPASQRRWGYYVIPVLYGDRFVARIDSRLIGTTWVISRWWWEPDVTPQPEMLTALQSASTRFLHYLRADGITIEDGVDQTVREALQAVAA